MGEKSEIVKINKWDGAAAKNAIDDAIREVLTDDLKCKETYAVIDGRLFLCTLAVGVAACALLWDYFYPFPQSREVLIICVSFYFISMGVLTLYTTFKERGIFVVAKEKVGNIYRTWEASSYVKKHDDKYNLVIVMRDSNGKVREANITKSFANFIDTNGTIVQNLVFNEINKLYNSLSSEKKENRDEMNADAQRLTTQRQSARVVSQTQIKLDIDTRSVPLPTRSRPTTTTTRRRSQRFFG